LIRAVRLLPGTVRVSNGQMEDVPPLEDTSVSVADSEAKATEQSALMVAEAEIKKLKSEIRSRESELSETRSLVQNLKTQMDSEREKLKRERSELHEKAESEAHERYESSRKSGYEDGFSSGHKEGLKKSEADMRAEYEGKFSNALYLLGAMSKSLEESRERLAISHAPQLVRLWEMMLRRMLLVRVDLDHEAAERVLGNILKRISDRERIMIYLNPADILMIESIKDTLTDSIRGVKFFELLSDDHIDRGSCLVETNLGIYDARWRTQLEQISSEVESLLMEIMASDETAESDGNDAD
jgi:flagellar assembly protein FliH